MPKPCRGAVRPTKHRPTDSLPHLRGCWRCLQSVEAVTFLATAAKYSEAMNSRTPTPQLIPHISTHTERVGSSKGSKLGLLGSKKSLHPPQRCPTAGYSPWGSARGTIQHWSCREVLLHGSDVPRQLPEEIAQMFTAAISGGRAHMCYIYKYCLRKERELRVHNAALRPLLGLV